MQVLHQLSVACTLCVRLSVLVFYENETSDSHEIYNYE